MNIRSRLEKIAAQVTEAGLAGKDMTSKLSSLLESNDLSANEIRRVAEMANRNTQLGMYKIAEDKRFKFALCSPGDLVEGAKTAAVQSMTAESKFAAAIDEAGGDPFAPMEYDGDGEKLSLYNHVLSPQVEKDARMLEPRRMLQELDRTHRELQLVKQAGLAAHTELMGKAHEAHDKALQSAVDLLMGGGITLTDLYLAVWTSCSGDLSGVDAIDHADDIMSVIISGLKKRGVPNHKMGFHWKGDMDALAKLDADDLLALAKRSAGIDKIPGGGDLSIQTQKQAQRYLENVHKHAPNRDDSPHPSEDAAEWLGIRPSQKEHPWPSSYLDEKVVSNTPGGRPKAINGDCEFVIGVRDLRGVQSRLTRSHNAQEYLGLKLKQIEHAMRQIKDAEKVAEAHYDDLIESVEEAKKAFGPVAGAAMKAIGTSAGRAGAKAGPSMGQKMKGLGRRLLTGAKKDPLNAAMVGLTGASMLQAGHEGRRSEKLQKQQHAHEKNMVGGDNASASGGGSV